MFLSQMRFGDISDLTIKQKTDIVYIRNDCSKEKYDAAFILGTDPSGIDQRAAMGISFYKTHDVDYLIPTGGVRYRFFDEEKSEAERMADILALGGVPEEVVLLENQAGSTVENIQFAAIELGRKREPETIRRIAIITSPYHLRRSLMIAKAFLPNYLEIYGFTEGWEEERGSWSRDATMIQKIETEIKALRRFIQNGVIPEIIF